MSRYAAIFAALTTKLQAYTGWSDANCNWPNRTFTPGTTGYWKVDFLPSSVEAALGVSGTSHERGIFQVTRFEPAKAGASTALAAADAMAAHFDCQALAGTGVTVQTLVPEVGAPQQEPGWFSVPVTVRFLAS